MTDPSPSQLPKNPPWPWLVLILALVWAVAIRIPLVLNVANHLDSDLAVDGLTLIDLLHGYFRLHYPGTPTVGTASLLVIAPFGLLGMSGLTALALGGMTIALLVILAIFWLAWRGFGPRVAAFSLVPLTFASTGVVWLSGRITGGHLLAVAWFGLALGMLHRLMKMGGKKFAALLGVLCGLGIWNDSMFLVAFGVMLCVGVVSWAVRGWSKSGVVEAGFLVVGLLVGLLPKFAGQLIDPYDAYRETFSVGIDRELLSSHLRIFGFDCLPRMIAGHRLPGLQAEPGGISPDGQALPAAGGGEVTGFLTTSLAIGLFIPSVLGLGFGKRDTLAIRISLIVVTGLVVVAFVINRNIFNSDNYRYLVFLILAWSVGCGRLLDFLSRKGAGGMLSAFAVTVIFAGCFTLDLANWYGRLGWVTDGFRPVVASRDEPVLAWLKEHPEATSLCGEYWDVYRLSMLTSGRVRGIPTGHYPNRFPEWTQALASGHATHVLARGTAIGRELYLQAKAAGGQDRLRASGGVIVDWP